MPWKPHEPICQQYITIFPHLWTKPWDTQTSPHETASQVCASGVPCSGTLEEFVHLNYPRSCAVRTNLSSYSFPRLIGPRWQAGQCVFSGFWTRTDDWKELNVPRLGYQGSSREPGLEEGLVGQHTGPPHMEPSLAQPHFAFLWDHHLPKLGLHFSVFFQYLKCKHVGGKGTILVFFFLTIRKYLVFSYFIWSNSHKMLSPLCILSFWQFSHLPVFALHLHAVQESFLSFALFSISFISSSHIGVCICATNPVLSEHFPFFSYTLIPIWLNTQPIILLKVCFHVSVL